MTAEIALMNKNAVALAADSAVTVGSGQKIFTSANKIFCLSNCKPMGVMVYGRADFMEIPWETLIKQYRLTLGTKSFDTVWEYGTDFMKYLRRQRRLFPRKSQNEQFYICITEYYRKLVYDIMQRTQMLMSTRGKIDENGFKHLINTMVNHRYRRLRKSKALPHLPKQYANKLRKRYKSIIEERIKEIFESLPLSKIVLKQLSQIAIYLFTKSMRGESYSGIVIAGFGDEEKFPAIRATYIEGFVENYLKIVEDKSEEIGFKTTSAVMPFAQKEMVYSFMEGINPDYEVEIYKSLLEILVEYPGIIIDSIKPMNKAKKRNLKRKLRNTGFKKFDQYRKQMQQYRKENFWQPIVQIVSALPKDELAAMAESLVNLTSFKRRISTDLETVGGPIDVAIVSKGDGFIWIKRKHYFKPELNPGFFVRYQHGV